MNFRDFHMREIVSKVGVRIGKLVAPFVPEGRLRIHDPFTTTASKGVALSVKTSHVWVARGVACCSVSIYSYVGDACDAELIAYDVREAAIASLVQVWRPLLIKGATSAGARLHPDAQILSALCRDALYKGAGVLNIEPQLITRAPSVTAKAYVSDGGFRLVDPGEDLIKPSIGFRR